MVPGGFPPQDLLEVYIYWGDFFFTPLNYGTSNQKPNKNGLNILFHATGFFL